MKRGDGGGQAVVEVNSARPYFPTPSERDGEDLSAPRLLLVSPHFPPSQAAGALRWEKLSRFAARHGYGLDVIAWSPDSLQDPDLARLETLPAGLRAFGLPPAELPLDRAESSLAALWKRARRKDGGDRPRVGAAREPTSVNRRRPTSFRPEDVAFRPTSVRSWLRAYWAWREYARGEAWARAAARLGAAIAAGRPPVAVITCGPPHMAHDAGRLLSRRLAVPLVLDMRDPWSLQQRLLEEVASPVWLRLARHHERRAVERACLVVCNTEPFREAMQSRYAEAAERIIAVMNGFDDDPLPAPPAPPAGEKFVLAYAGSIYLDRDPRPLFRAAARAVATLSLDPARFGIEFVGNVEDYGGVPLSQMARQEQVGDYVRTRPFLPRAELMTFLAGATMLVSLPQDSDLAIPSKVFEYMRFPAWLLALAEPGSATGAVVLEAGGDQVSPDDVDEMARVITRRYVEFSEKGRPRPLAECAGSRFSRRKQAEVLLQRLSELHGRKDAAG